MVLVCVVVVSGCGRGNGISSGYDGDGGGVRGSISCNGDNSQDLPENCFKYSQTKNGSPPSF